MREILTLGIIFGGCWPLIGTLFRREQEHRKTERDLGAAKGREQAKQEYIAELTAQKAEVERQAAALAAINAELDRKNATLQALYDERDAMAQDLAARNDRLADATHEIKTDMVPMTFKVDDFITAAASDTQRADAVWLLSEIQRVAIKMQKIIYEAKITNPLPPLANKETLSIHLIGKYFFYPLQPHGSGASYRFKLRKQSWRQGRLANQ